MAKNKDYNEIAKMGVGAFKVREMLDLKRVSINDFDTVKDRVFDYLEYCDEKPQIPTVRGLCVALGVGSQTVNAWLKDHSEHETSIFLNQVMDIMADNVEQKALNGELDRVVSIFTLKSSYGYRENQDITITHKKAVQSKSIEQLEEEIENEIIDVEFTEKD